MTGGPDGGGKSERSLASRLIWFVALWIASVAAVGAVALAIRYVLR